MAGIARGFLGEGIERDDVLPFLRGTDEEICLKAEALLGLCFQQALQLGGRSPVRAEEEVPALEQRPDVGETELREEIAQVDHRYLLVAANIDAPQEGDVDQSAELTSGRLSCALRSRQGNTPLRLCEGRPLRYLTDAGRGAMSRHRYDRNGRQQP